MMRMPRMSWLKRRRNAALVASGVLLLAAIVLVFHPHLQTQLLREQASQRLDTFTIGRVHLLPWSLQVEGLNVRHAGLEIEVEEANLRFSALKLVLGVARVSRLAVRGLTVDLRGIPPSETESQPFAGLFALLDHGIALEFDGLDVAGRLFVDEVTAATFRINGGGIAPGTEGALDVDTVVRRSGEEGRAEVAGSLTIAQSEAGTIVALGADLLARIVAPQLPQEELIELLLHAEPVEEPLVDDAGETTGSVIVGDRFRVTVSKPGSGADLLWISVSGTHDARSRTVAGDYELRAHDGLVHFYASGAAVPKFAQDARGEFRLDLAVGTVELDFLGETGVSALARVLGANEALPDRLEVRNNFRVAMTAGVVELREFAATVSGPAGEPMIAAALSEPVSISLDAPGALLDEERTLATLDVRGIPLDWLNGLLPEPVLRAGTIGGAFRLASGKSALALAPAADFSVEDAAFDESFAVPDLLQLRASPLVRYRAETLTIKLKQLAVRLGERELAALDLDMTSKVGGQEPPVPDIHLRGHFDLNGLAALPLLSERLADHVLPEGLRAELDTRLSANAERIRIRALEASVRQHDAPPLVTVSALQAFTIALGEGAPEFRNPDGELARIAIDDLDLTWLDPFIAGASVAGALDGGTFIVSAGADDRLSVTTREPLTMRAVSVRVEPDVLVEKLSLSLRPEIDYRPGQLDVRYDELEAGIGGEALAAGSGAVTLPLAEDGAGEMHASGHVEFDLGVLRRLPALAHSLGRLPAKRRWQLELDYDLAGDPDRIELQALRAGVAIDGETRVRFANETTLVLRPRVDEGEDLAQHLTGGISAELTGLSSALLGDLVPLGDLSFADLSVHATLRSDGRVLTAETTEPLTLSGARVGNADASILNRFSASAAGGVRAVGQSVDATLDTLTLAFDARGDRPAVSGDVSFTLEPSHVIPLRRMQAGLTGFLPALLDQPVLMPGHSLRAGNFRLDATVGEDGAIGSVAVLEGLEASEPLAISRMQAEANGAMAADGRGFSFAMPVTGSGRSGDTDGVLAASYDPASSEKALLNLEFTSNRFLLNDVLATLQSIRSRSAVRGPSAKGAAPSAATTAPDTVADESAFWDLLPYDTHLDYRIRDLYYTDYVIFNDVAGQIKLTSSRFTLESLSARFHDSSMKFDGALEFIEGSAKPYELQLEGKLSEFDLNQFFTELVPGEKPRVEGLFSISFDGYGVSPNMAQFRNELLFDMKLKSREGLFRPLPPGSALMAGASDVLGIVGEGLSYVPTGGFGAGAVSRLVNYIAVIDYDRIDIHMVRDETRDIVIRQFLVQSPTISLTAEGGIDYADGKDILDSPLSLDAHLNMSGKGAAILYSMNLLEDEQDAFGYYKGPAFRIRGTPAAAESNFTEIVNAAADGTVKGAITRPISGLIGNIKHRWFGEPPQRYQGDGPGTATPSVPDQGPGAPVPAAP